MNANGTKTLTTEEANAVIIMGRLMKVKNGIERFAASTPSVGLDWLLERGYVQTGTTNASARAFSGTWAQSNAYATKTGRAWFHASPGVGVALLVAAKAMNADPAVIRGYASLAGVPA